MSGALRPTVFKKTYCMVELLKWKVGHSLLRCVHTQSSSTRLASERTEKTLEKPKYLVF